MLVARYGVSIGEGGNRNSSLDSMWWRETWWECVEKRMRFCFCCLPAKFSCMCMFLSGIVLFFLSSRWSLRLPFVLLRLMSNMFCGLVSNSKERLRNVITVVCWRA